MRVLAVLLVLAVLVFGPAEVGAYLHQFFAALRGER